MATRRAHRILCAGCRRRACECLVSRHLVEKALVLVDEVLRGRVLAPELGERFACWRAAARQEDAEGAALARAPRRLRPTLALMVATYAGPVTPGRYRAEVIDAARRWVSTGGLQSSAPETRP